MRITRWFAAAAAAAAITGSGLVVAGSANAGTVGAGWLDVTMYSSGNGAGTSWDWGDPQLTVGPDTSTTYAELVINNAAGRRVPKPVKGYEPMFKTDHYAAGSPRYVIELDNGHSLEGYPGLDLSGKTAPDSAGMAWAVDNGSTYTDYKTAYANASVKGQRVREAFIVADGDQAAGTTDTLTGVEYGGWWIAPPLPLNGIGGTVKSYSGECVTASGRSVVLRSCNGSRAQQWWEEPDGTIRNNAAGPQRCLDDTRWGGQGTKQGMWTCTGGNNQVWSNGSKSGYLVSAANGLCLDDPGWATASGTRLDLWECMNQRNEFWSRP